MKQYAECKQTDIEAQNQWFAVCKEKGIPYIWVGLRTKYASVNWDHTSIDRRQDFLLMKDSEAVSNEIQSLFQEYKGSKSNYSISSLVGKIDNLSPESARILAVKIFGVLNSRLESKK